MDLAVSYSNIRRVIRDGLVVEYHDATLSLGSEEAVADVALIVEFNDEGKATSINEYLDSAALATLMERPKPYVGPLFRGQGFTMIERLVGVQ